MNSNAFGEIADKTRVALFDIWRGRWIGVAAACVVGIALGAVVSLLPDRYQADARIYVDTQTVLKPLMVGLAVQPDIDQQVRMLARTLVTRPNVERLMDTPELGLTPKKQSDREAGVAALMSKIKVEPSGTGNLYVISYKDTDPTRARRVVENLVALFMNSSAGEQKRDSQEAGRFIDEQIRSHEAKLAEAENRLKEFKLRNFGVSGVSNQDYFTRMSALSDSVKKLQTDLHAAEQSRDAFRRELASESPQLPPEAQQPTQPAQRSDAEVRLDLQRQQLDDLLRRFTDQHPDVLSARRVIAALEQQVRAEAQARARTDAERGRGASAATSPVYQRIRISLAQTEADIASFRSRLGAEQSRLEEVRSTANRVPQVEAELAQLNRDYEVIRKNYELLVSRRESASLGLKLDESSHMADFRLVEPPRVSPGPVAPSKFVLAIGALFLSLVAGLGAAYVASAVKPTFTDTNTLRDIAGHQVLGAVSLFVTDDMRQRARSERVRFGAVAASLMALQVVWAAWILISPKI